MTKTDLPTRRTHITERIDAPAFGGEFAVTVGFDPRNNMPCEVFVTQRAKSGTQMERLLYDIGVVASKIMQDQIRAVRKANKE